MPKILDLEVRCECGQIHIPTQKDFTYITPNPTYFHFLVEWICSACGTEGWDEGHYDRSWLP